MPKFSHLHVHSQYSLLDGAAEITAMFNKASKDGMPALALTDHGNMFGAFQFVAAAEKLNANGLLVKPIVGCEFYVVENRHVKKFGEGKRDQRYHQLLLAKNAKGYANLTKLCSLGYMEGFYSKFPRIDKELIEKYHEGLIATTCCLAAYVPRTIARKGEAEGEKEFKWWLDLFGEDYYIELQRHNIPEQNQVNEVLLRFAEKYHVKVIASNDSHYVEQEDFNAHDILLCINTGEKQSTPSFRDYGEEDVSSKGQRFAFYNDQFFLKTTGQMSELFSDLPQAIDNTNEIADKVEILSLKRDILLPNFPVPPQFLIHTAPFQTGKKEITPDVRNQWEYLKSLCYEGAKRRYSEITPLLEERINFELQTIHDMGFAGYFLIVMDFIRAGREMGVFIGPGRGSAAGSVVAYCIGITNIDPIKYDLLFERFLNPERISMPDIDTDFDDQGRQKVIDYVVDKYGKNQVAQIVTFGTMAARMSIKDVARVLDLPLPDSNTLAKLVPGKPGISLNRVLKAPVTKSEDSEKSLEAKEELGTEDLENARKLQAVYNYEGPDANQTLQRKVLREASVLEGSVRNIGIHAAGIIIAPEDLTNILPVATAKDSDLLITQFEGTLVEDAGVIKMDFLGLKNLTIIRDALKMIRENHGIEIDIDAIPLDDPATYELYQRGETNGTFQFESPGMQKWLQQLKPDKFEDLIAMNALYRPGPMDYIPQFVARKHGKEPTAYDLPDMEEYLKDTYGITVYQEQVMLLSQKLAGFSKGKADELRKAMGKKLRKKIDELKPLFIQGGMERNYPENVLNKIWTDWEAFASYAFNKSHSTCYALVAYQTAYLKVHYPSEYMAALLTNVLSDLNKVTFYLEECKRMGLKVLGPDINESSLNFAVNKKQEIRFGLMALKGVGEAAAESFIQERQENGNYTDIFDFIKRVNLRTVNKSSIESMVQAGVFDSFPEMHRAQFFAQVPGEDNLFLEKLIRFGGQYQAQENSQQVSLFGDSETAEITYPKIPVCEPWSNMEQLKRERAVAGFFISGHPLDDYSIEIKQFTNCNLKILSGDLAPFHGRELVFAGIISQARPDIPTKSGGFYGRFTLEDFEGSREFVLFQEDYLKNKHFFVDDTPVFIRARVQSRYGRDNELDLKIAQISLLSEVMDRLAKGIVVYLPLPELNEQTVKQLVGIVKANKGDARLKIHFADANHETNVELSSLKYKVRVSRLVNELKGLNKFSFKIV